MVVLQDFEALTPNLLARTVETAEGGGLVVLLLESVTSLKQIYTLSMVCMFFPKSINCKRKSLNFKIIKIYLYKYFLLHFAHT
jgi:tRNA(Met) C34 N-acetyltransferase TmcA